MLERKWQGISEPQSLLERDGNRDFISLWDVTGFVRRYLILISIFTILGLLGSGFYILTTDPTYTARTQILIEPKISQLLQRQTGEVNLSLDTAQVESQIAVMQSEKIAMMVISELKLSEDPVFNQPRNPAIIQRMRKLEALFASSWALEDRRWFTGLLQKHVGLPADDANQEAGEFEGSRRTMANFRDGLDVRRVGVSYAIDVSFSSRDAQTAADIANATAEAFVREQVENKAAAAREGGAWLERRLKELRTQMNTATQVAQEFRAKHDYRVGRRLGGAFDDGDSVPERDKPAGHDGPTLEELEVTADTYKKMYESFLEAFTSSVSQQSYPVADARVITPASRPLIASHPRSKLILALGTLAGCMVGVGIAYARLTQDRTLRSMRQIQENLGLECLGELPPAAWRRGFGRLDEVARSPRSTYADSLRRVMTAISLADVTQPVRTMGVTSALPGEGKSTCASNLATLYTKAGLRTLVVDADFIHSTLSTKLLTPRTGSVDIDGGEEKVSRLVRPSTLGGFDILPSADLEARRLMAPKGLQTLWADLPGYDMIIVDLPPLSSGAEKLAISATLDGVVLVVEWGKTPLDLVLELSRSLQANKAPIIGVLLTKVRALSPRRYTRLNCRAAY
jgi:uncharacterized protein involved in exopolysaccharide biosynthesis/Mrp family chromosome partitioning ATPase